MQTTTIQSVGIIGLGEFGRLVAQLVPKSIAVYGHDPEVSEITGVQITSLPQIAKADVVVLAIPLAAYDTVLSNLHPLLRPDTLVIDTCSVKVKPEALIERYLPGHPEVLLTHPLFGPRSAAAGVEGQRIVVTRCQGGRARQVLHHCQTRLAIKMEHMTSQTHDQAMAQTHALTFFVARGLRQLEMPARSFTVPSFQLMANLIDVDIDHSEALFTTLQKGNPFAASARQELLQSLQQVDQHLRAD